MGTRQRNYWPRSARWRRTSEGRAQRDEILSIADARDFLTHVVGDPLEAAFALFLTRGLRRSEVVGLCWDAVDLIGGTLSVKRTLISVDDKATESTPKTKSSRRTIPSTRCSSSCFTSAVPRRKPIAAEAGEAWVGSGYIFTDALGRCWHLDYYGDRFDKLAAEARLPLIRLHDTRHTAATLMLADGVPVPVVAEILGHESPSITLQLYSHAIPGMGRKAGEELSKALLGLSSPGTRTTLWHRDLHDTSAGSGTTVSTTLAERPCERADTLEDRGGWAGV